jgi:hypothetical protein
MDFASVGYSGACAWGQPLAASGVDDRGGTFSSVGNALMVLVTVLGPLNLELRVVLRFNFNVYTRGNENFCAQNYYFTFDFGNLNPKDPQLPRSKWTGAELSACPYLFSFVQPVLPAEWKDNLIATSQVIPFPNETNMRREAHAPLSIFNRKRLFDLAWNFQPSMVGSVAEWHQ